MTLLRRQAWSPDLLKFLDDCIGQHGSAATVQAIAEAAEAGAYDVTNAMHRAKLVRAADLLTQAAQALASYDGQVGRAVDDRVEIHAEQAAYDDAEGTHASF